jgi:hypothetical protein
MCQKDRMNSGAGMHLFAFCNYMHTFYLENEITSSLQIYYRVPMIDLDVFLTVAFLTQYGE